MRFNRKYLYAITVLAFLWLGFASVSTADDNRKVPVDPAWAAAYTAWEQSLSGGKLSDAEQCQHNWDFVWPWAKRGNLQARAMIYVLLTIPKRQRLVMPGLPTDDLSLFRDTIIFYVHSLGVQYEDVVDEDILSVSGEMAEFHQGEIGRLYSVTSTHLRACIKAAHSREAVQPCAKVAVDEGIVPSFESYAAEVDALIAQGLRPTCVNTSSSIAPPSASE
jgi:hypothetical protein